MLEFLGTIGPHIIGAAIFVVSVVASAHVILNKRNTRSAIGWVGLIWFVPFFGALLYVLLGINLIRRRAKTLRAEPPFVALPSHAPGVRSMADIPNRFHTFTRLADRIIHKPLVGGNEITPLLNGDRAYPAMVEAIDRAESSVNLCTYIFGNDRAGRMFTDAFSRAVGRGVQARVIVDDVGSRYSLPRATTALREAGVKVALFLPTMSPLRLPFVNLRNHRKIMVVDGRVGFTGGMNIREDMLLDLNSKHNVQDIHFRVDGPVVAHLQEVFAGDWAFCTGEVLDGERWFPGVEEAGSSIARGIPDGPDEDIGKLHWMVHGALNAAKSSVRIVTPYFTPDAALIKTLNLTALRGVEVDIVLPEKNNLPFMKWASMHLLWQLLEQGCRVWFTPPPFDHSKLMVVDDVWSLVGSANWDSRSFRLNFEFSLACYDRRLATTLGGVIDKKLSNANRVTLDGVNARPLLIKIRDGAACLFSPYL